VKITGIALLAICFALLLFAGISHFALTPSPDDINASSTPSSPIFSPAITLTVAALAGISGFLVLRFGGRGYIEKTPQPLPNRVN